MAEQIIEALGAIPNEIKLIIISMLPIIELRGAIPVGVLLGMPPIESFLISVVGNLIPIPFVILLGRPIFNWLKKTKLFAGLMEKLEKRIEKKADSVMKKAALGLYIFVAIPLPGTGAWTGALIASMFDMRFKYALPAIVLGVLTAGIIMTVGSYGISSLVGIFV
ncbi:MAG: small multi-drug export protein [Clostridia bacterium]|nr:small multi-drug export protein [Clostridia bacterium]